MCGIAGFLNWQARSKDEIQRVATRMTDRLAHRGPDDAGVWTDAGLGLALGHRRLSILDLSASGHQPMHSSCGRFSIVYNGEIYNHSVIRAELEAQGVRFRSTCDTEVLLEGISRWGLQATLRRLVGMFAFAVWDGRERRLTLARDALGIKPLYYGWMDGCLLFASELKAMREHPAFRGEVDRRALSLYLRYGYIPAPYSIYLAIRKLPPGSLLEIPFPAEGQEHSPAVWWSIEEAVANGLRQPFSGGAEVAVEELDRRLREAVSIQMRADVPLGAFLSGGIDSSTVVALMQDQSERRIATFSIGFEASGYDEAPYARAVARHLGTEHTEHYVTPQEARDAIPRLPVLYDEPFADSSQIPTFLVCQLARKNVSVCLSGDGGDELYGGYNRYETMRRLWSRVSRCPRAIRGPLSRGAGSLAARLADSSVLRRKLGTLSEFTAASDGLQFYQTFNGHWRQPGQLVCGLDRGQADALPRFQLDQQLGYIEQMMYVDSVSYLPDDILVKVDRASMAVALEVRVPMLDQRLVEFAWSLPREVRMREGASKWLLRRVLQRYLPPSLFERPKMGFGVPIGDWLRGPLRAWAEELLSPNRLQAEGHLRPEPITAKWREHLNGRYNWQYLLWDVLMFQAWLGEQA